MGVGTGRRLRERRRRCLAWCRYPRSGRGRQPSCRLIIDTAGVTMKRHGQSDSPASRSRADTERRQVPGRRKRQAARRVAEWHRNRSRVSVWRVAQAWIVVNPVTPDDSVSSNGSASGLGVAADADVGSWAVPAAVVLGVAESSSLPGGLGGCHELFAGEGAAHARHADPRAAAMPGADGPVSSASIRSWRLTRGLAGRRGTSAAWRRR